METINTSTNSVSGILRKSILVTLLSGMLILAVLLILIIGFQLVYVGRVFPGVNLDGADLGGLTASDALSRISQTEQYPLQGVITLQDGDRIWQASPAQLGLLLDPQSSVQSALSIGRQGSLVFSLAEQFGALYYGHSASPVMTFDQRPALQLLETIKQQVDVPMQEAGISLQGTEVVTSPGQIGRSLDLIASLNLIEAQLRTRQSGIVPLVINDIRPLVLDASSQAESVRQMLSQPLTLSLPADQPDEAQLGPWVIQPADLAAMLHFEKQVQSDSTAVYQVVLDPAVMRKYLTDLVSTVSLTPQNTRFIFNDDTRQLNLIQSAVIGRDLNVEKSLAAIQQQLLAGQHSAFLQFDFTQPQVTDNTTAQQLGITELLWAETSYFRGSGSARLQNIQTAAARFHGLLVAPGATFSMGEMMGDISLDNGYAEAPIIIGDQTIRGVGGGVCQVSTTLFRAVFHAGFPIVERHPHSYRVGYYEQNATGHDSSLAGLDATVYFPLVDLKFTNDSNSWLLMETYFNSSRYSLTWKLYSTSDGRTVTWDPSGPTNLVDPPKPVYTENPDLAKDEIKQTEYAVQGADVTVTRTVSRNNIILYNDVFRTHYVPWGDVFQYGPGTKIPDQPSQ